MRPVSGLSAWSIPSWCSLKAMDGADAAAVAVGAHPPHAPADLLGQLRQHNDAACASTRPVSSLQVHRRYWITDPLPVSFTDEGIPDEPMYDVILPWWETHPELHGFKPALEEVMPIRVSSANLERTFNSYTHCAASNRGQMSAHKYIMLQMLRDNLEHWFDPTAPPEDLL